MKAYSMLMPPATLLTRLGVKLGSGYEGLGMRAWRNW
jgi:hypothetical protein